MQITNQDQKCEHVALKPKVKVDQVLWKLSERKRQETDDKFRAYMVRASSFVKTRSGEGMRRDPVRVKARNSTEDSR